MTAYDAIILAGGLARRLGGVDKPGLVVGGVPLVERVAAAVGGAERLVVVGPPRDLPGAIFAREDPPGGGPVPALRAGLALVDAPWVAVLAGDLPFLTADHVDALRAAAEQAEQAEEPGAAHPAGKGRSEVGAAVGVGPPAAGSLGVGPTSADSRGVGAAWAGGGAAGAVLVDGTGREQWLTGVWRTATLRAALDGYGGRSLHGLLAPLDPVRLALPGSPWFDCDTPDDLRTGAEMNVLTEWTAIVCKELGLDPADVDRDMILLLTKEVAHGVARPAAPLTAYLLGLAEGAGTAPDDAVARLTTLAHNWEQATTETLTDG